MKSGVDELIVKDLGVCKELIKSLYQLIQPRRILRTQQVSSLTFASSSTQSPALPQSIADRFDSLI